MKVLLALRDDDAREYVELHNVGRIGHAPVECDVSEDMLESLKRRGLVRSLEQFADDATKIKKKAHTDVKL